MTGRKREQGEQDSVGVVDLMDPALVTPTTRWCRVIGRFRVSTPAYGAGPPF